MLYALSDLHLGFGVNKPMNIFGGEWVGHEQKVWSAWQKIVCESDVVLMPGDISWAMNLQEAKLDLQWIGGLHGQKVMIRGNHDYWWNGINKVRKSLNSKTYALQNDAFEFPDFTVCGSRGWLLPGNPKFTEHDALIHQREIERLRLSLERGSQFGKPLVVMMHYPPLPADGQPSTFSDLMTKYQVRLCVYGHLHGSAHRYAFEGVASNVQYRCVSADYLHFRPLLLTPWIS
ncbi:hypothetical protein D2Q93_15380 [Alicyclobacillaceae bacterium I2511]|nr:hypothetical protein D2Q93_15380 [Alicyclobacillaceae bacterium I2511]